MSSPIPLKQFPYGLAMPRTSMAWPQASGPLRRIGLMLPVLALSAGLLGCSRSAEAPAAAAAAPAVQMEMRDTAGAGAPAPAPSVEFNAARAKGVSAADQGSGVSAEAVRFLAISHQLVVQAPPALLADRWQAVRDACARLDCELESAELRRDAPQMPAGASLSMRVAPKDLNTLLAAIGDTSAGVQIMSHQTQSEDKTGEVVDVQAHLKNRLEYRDGLRELLNDKSTKRDLADLLAIRDALSNTQAEIDSALTRQKLLERQTSKQRVDISFQPQHTVTGSTFSPIAEAWRSAGMAMEQTVAAVVLASAYALPLLALLVVPWAAWRLLRRRRRRTLPGTPQR